MSLEHNNHWHKDVNFDFLHALETNVMSVTNLSGLFYPEERIEGGYYTIQESHVQDDIDLILPPPDLRHWYGYRDGKYHDNLYIEGGEKNIRAMRKILLEDDFNVLGENILEFGCSAGRLLRHFYKEAAEAEVWGVDLHSAAIHWAQANLSPPFNFFVNTTAPHLPFEDNYFGFIFAGSVWTHIGELDDAWLLEMRRICRPGGRIYITISDENTLVRVKNESPEHASNQHVKEFDEATEVLSKPFVQFVTRTTPWLQRSVYSKERWTSKIERWLKVKLVRENAYGWQTGVLLEK